MDRKRSQSYRLGLLARDLLWLVCVTVLLCGVALAQSPTKKPFHSVGPTGITPPGTYRLVAMYISAENPNLFELTATEGSCETVRAAQPVALAFGRSFMENHFVAYFSAFAVDASWKLGDRIDPYLCAHCASDAKP